MDDDGKLLEPARETGRGGTHFGRSLRLRLLWIASSLLLGLLLLGALADAYLRPLPGSTTDDEVRTPAARQAFFQTWQAALARLQQGSMGLWEPPPSAQRFSWWDRSRKLPNESGVRLVLRRHLSSDIDLRGLQPILLETLPDGVRISYLVSVEPRSSEFLIPIEPAGIPAGTGKIEEGLTRDLLFAEGLPPGQVFTLGDKILVASAGSSYRFQWTVRRATADAGLWRIREVDPTPFEASPDLEGMAIAASKNAPVLLVCSQDRLNQIEAEQEAAWKAFQDRCGEIRQKTDQYATQVLKGVPGIPRKGQPFGVGTGTPTTTLEAAGLGLFGGALLGGFSGHAGLGADLGAVGGGPGGYWYSQERRPETSLREARRKILSYRNGLIGAYEEELQERAREREASLFRGETAGFGERPRKN
ncbi:hypothetical protein [Verrucomicrobium sp. 3C]|uniref:hypothetical protein n=1 Tax=Verrucomicrobium sp. 3C TaxID=1134055 RepID=UPI000373ABF0|nr:hypothetical protein [Verrucomicrobium sp. 3C]